MSAKPQDKRLAAQNGELRYRGECPHFRNPSTCPECAAEEKPSAPSKESLERARKWLSKACHESMDYNEGTEANLALEFDAIRRECDEAAEELAEATKSFRNEVVEWIRGVEADFLHNPYPQDNVQEIIAIDKALADYRKAKGE